MAEKLDGLGCTASVVQGDATVDGSAYAGMNADCSDCDARIVFVPGSDHSVGETRPVYPFSGAAPRWIGYGRGEFYEPQPGQALTKEYARIPQIAERTYGYWEATLPLMNEKGLGLGESSCAARLMNWPVDGKPVVGTLGVEGALDITNLMQLALERCATAECGVREMGRLAEEWG